MHTTSAPPARFRSVKRLRLWTWAAMGLAIAMGLISTWRQFNQAETDRRSRHRLGVLREARVELVRGFLGVTLVKDPGSASETAAEFARLDRAVAALEAGAGAVGVEPLGQVDAGLLAGFRNGVSGFRQTLAAFRGGGAGSRSEAEPAFHSAFHELEQGADRLTAALQSNLEVLTARQDRRFAAFGMMAMMLVAAMCGALYYVSRREASVLEVLHESEERYRTLVDHLPVGMFLADTTGRILMGNPAALRLARLSAHENVAGRHVLDFQVPEERAQAREILEAALRSGGFPAFDGTVLCADGARVSAELSGAVVKDGEGRPVAFMAMAQDITARKEAETALRRNEAHLRTLVNTLPDLVWLKDPQGVYLACNKRFERFFGVPEAEVLGKTDYDFSPREQADAFRARDRAAVEAGTSLMNEEEVIFASDGHRELLETIKTPMLDADGSLIGVLGIARDITERKRAEAELEGTRAMLAEGQRIAHIGSFEYIAATAQTIWSDEEFRIYGLPPAPRSPSYADLMQRHFHPEDAALVDRTFSAAVRSGTVYELEHRIVWPDGSVRDLYDRAQPMFDAQGRLVKYVGATLDITERKRAETALRESERRFRSLVDCSPVALGLVGVAGEIVFLNRSFTQLFGYDTQDIPTLAEWWRLAYPDAGYQREVAGDWDAMVADGVRGAAGEPARERHITCKDGGVRTVQVSSVTLAEGVLVSFMDVTERKRAEEELRASEFKYRVVAENTFDWEFWLSPEGEYLYTSPACGRIIGHRPEEFAADPQLMDRVIHPDDLPRFQAHRCLACTGESQSELELRVIRPDGAVRWMAHVCTAVRDAEGRFHGVRGSNRDITERKRAEALLREREQQIRLFVEHTPAGIAVLDRDLRYLIVSQRWLSDYRLSGQDLIGRLHYEVFPEISERWKAVHRRCLAGATERCEADPFPRADGTVDWVHWEIRPWRNAQDEIGGLIIFSELITARKQAEEALAESERLLRAVMDLVPHFIFVKDRESRHLLVNRACAEASGLTPEQMTGRSDLEFVADRAEAEAFMRDDLKVIDGGQSLPLVEERLTDVTGRTRILQTTKIPFLAPGGVPALMGVSVDITERKKAEAALRRSEAHLRTLVNTLPDLVWLKDPQGVYLACNARFQSLYGATESEIVGRTDDAFVDRELAEFFREHDRAAIAAGRPSVNEERLRFLSDGHWELLETIKTPMFDGDGTLVGVLGIARDVTQRKRAEEAALQSEQRLNFALQASRTGAWSLDVQNHTATRTLIHAQIFGYPDAGGPWGMDSFLGHVLPDDRERVRQAVQAGIAARTGWTFECRIRRADGPLRWVFIAGGFEQDPASARIYGIIQDITERKQVEESLRRSEEQVRLKLDSILSPDVEVEEEELVNLLDLPALQALLENFSQLSRAVVAVLDLKGRVLLRSGWQDICTQFHRVHPETAHNCTESDLALAEGVRPGEHAAYHCQNGLWDVVTPLMIGGKHVGNIFTGQFFYENDTVDEGSFCSRAERCGFDREAYLAALRRVPRVSRQRVETLMLFLTRFAELISKSSYSNLKLAKALVQQRRQEEDLRASEAQFRAMFELASIGMAQADPQTARWLRVNRKFCEITGYAEDELLRLRVPEITHPDDRARDRELFERVVRGEAPEYRLEKRYTRKDGAVAWANVNMTVLRDAVGQPWRTMATVEDITVRKRMEQERAAMQAQIQQQQKLESIGTLASGVAHEINNPINGIMNYAQLIQDRLPGDSPLTEFTGEIMHETQRVATIVRNLLTFARNEKQSHSPARMVDIVESVLSLVHTVIRHDQIELHVSVPEELPALKCRSQQIQQVIMNLITNARDALNERFPGHHPDKILNLDAQLVQKEGRRWIRLTVEDHGTGIPPEVRGRMFDPFFTTKGRDKGTGLGLSISHGIVKEHHGDWTVASEPGRFTRMQVDLPVDNGWEM